MVAITPPDGSAWTLDVVAIEGGVALEVGFDLAGDRKIVQLAVERPASRVLARAILAAGGDAGERTFTGGSGNTSESRAVPHVASEHGQMPRRPANVTQADIARAIRAMKAEGLPVARVIVRSDGVAVETTGDTDAGKLAEKGRVVVL